MAALLATMLMSPQPAGQVANRPAGPDPARPTPTTTSTDAFAPHPSSAAVSGRTTSNTIVKKPGQLRPAPNTTTTLALPMPSAAIVVDRAGTTVGALSDVGDAGVIGSDPTSGLTAVWASSEATPLHFAKAASLKRGESVTVGSGGRTAGGTVTAMDPAATSTNATPCPLFVVSLDDASSITSGQLVLDRTGGVIGVTAGRVGNDVVVVPTEVATRVGWDLAANSSVGVAWLGMSVNAPVIAVEGSDDRIRIESLFVDTPAMDSGLQPGDVITAIDGANVDSGWSLIVSIRAHRPGDTVVIAYERQGQLSEIPITLATRPASF